MRLLSDIICGHIYIFSINMSPWRPYTYRNFHTYINTCMMRMLSDIICPSISTTGNIPEGFFFMNLFFQPILKRQSASTFYNV